MRPSFPPVVLLASVFLGGCNFSGRTPVLPAPPVVITPAPTEQELKEAKTREAQLSKASAAVGAAAFASEQLPPGNATEAVRGEVDVAAQNLPPPTEADRAEALARVAAALRGDLDTARKGWAAAQSEAQRLTAELTSAQEAAQKAREDAAALLQTREAEYAAKFAELKRIAEEAQRARDQLRAQIEDENRQKLVRVLTWVTSGLLLAGILVLVLSQGTQWRIGGGLLVSGFGLAGATRVINHWLFPWACWIVAAVIVGAVGWSVWESLQNRKKLLSTAAAKDQLEGVATKVVAAIEAGKKTVDDLTPAVDLTSLSRAMGDDAKALVKQLRAKLLTDDVG